ncbi:TetR/AcrR family transcriptional regulator [Thioclava sp. FR2]|uniref:TetR/AcrR family transcriptional regulator n=1 Tax=Thioclava sp. FR2 TaxID=3445780 RepID=UPI003EC000B2
MEKPAKMRLAPQDWILAGFRALVSGGHAAIRAEALARDLGATKGSFYWHFKDLRDFHEKMLEAWRGLATTQITRTVLEADLAPFDRVMLLMDMVSIVPDPRFGGPAIEPAIRAWALAEPWVHQVVAEVDRQRLSDTVGLLQGAGLCATAARHGAETLYAMVIGYENLRLTQRVDMREALHAQVRVLFSAS